MTALRESNSDWLQKANSCFDEERWADAAAAFEQALVSQGGSAQDWYRFGVACLELKQLPRAVEWFDKAVSIDPSHGKAWNNIGVCRQQLGEQALAVDAYRRALDTDPLLLPAVLNFAHLCLADGDAVQAAELLERAASLEQGNWTTWGVLARVRLRLGQTEAAEQAYRKSMELVAPKVVPHIKAAESALAAANYAAAESALAAALEYMPDHPSLLHIYAALRGQDSGRASQAYVISLFDDFAETYDESMRKNLQYRAPERIAGLVVPMLKGRFPLRIVDLGCGTGFMGEALAELNAEIVGVDLSQKMLERAAKRGRYARFVQGDVVEELMRVAEGDIHAVVAADVLIYLGDLKPLFFAVKHALARGGLFAFSVEALEQGTFQVRPSGRYAHADGYLRALAQQAGLVECALDPFDLRFERDRYIKGLAACFKAA